jgi:tetratricopeptide (TPR) repeat protein
MALGKPDAGLQHAEHAARISREIDDPEGEASARDVQGECLQRQGKYNEAIAAYEISLRLRRTVADIHQESETLARLAGVYESLGDCKEAQKSRDVVEALRSGAE